MDSTFRDMLYRVYTSFYIYSLDIGYYSDQNQIGGLQW
jgi:hypothetical protein